MNPNRQDQKPRRLGIRRLLAALSLGLALALALSPGIAAARTLPSKPITNPEGHPPQ